MKKLKKLFQKIKVLAGKDQDWKKQMDRETEEGIIKINDDHAKRGIFHSGIRVRAVTSFELKRKQEKRDEERKRLLELLGVLPCWFSLLISLIALIFSILLWLLSFRAKADTSAGVEESLLQNKPSIENSSNSTTIFNRQRDSSTRSQNRLVGMTR